MGKRLVSFRRYHLHCFYLCLLIHTDFFSADRAAPLISPCLVANPFKIQHKPCKIWICTYPRSGPRHCEDSLGVCLEKKKNKLWRIPVRFVTTDSQLVKTPQGGRFRCKPETNWHRSEMSGGATQQECRLENKKHKHLILLNCNEEAKLDHCFKN